MLTFWGNYDVTGGFGSPGRIPAEDQQVKRPQNSGPKIKTAVCLLKRFGIIVFVYKKGNALWLPPPK